MQQAGHHLTPFYQITASPLQTDAEIQPNKNEIHGNTLIWDKIAQISVQNSWS